MQNISSLFDEIAPSYDFLNHLFSVHIDRWWRYQALHSVELPTPAKLRDVCTGTADVAIAAAKAYPSSHIYGIDFSGRMLRYGQKKIDQQQLEKMITMINGDALHLPFDDNTFHAAFLSFGLRNLAERGRGIQEIIRVLRPNGHLVILEFAPPSQSLFGRMFHLYLGRVIAGVGGLISQSPAAYRYLHTSIEQFPEPREIVRLLRVRCAHLVRCQPMTFGIVYLYVVQKLTAPL